MPYRKQYRKRRPRRRGQITYGQIGTKIYRDVAKLRALINVEYHSLLTSFTVDPSSSGAVVNLTAIAQGDTTVNRQGNKIRLKYLSVRGSVIQNASAANTNLRMMIVRDNNGNTTQPAITDLFVDVAGFVANGNKNGLPQANSRFTILWDKFVQLSDANGDMRAYSYSMSLDHHTFFTGAGATDEGKGHLYLFIGSNEATNDPVVKVDSMVKWIDN